MKSFDTFIELISDQMDYGAKKYQLNAKRESTDELFDAHGKNWLFGTIDKYFYRFKNLQRERDLLKIATYIYLIWIKRGFFLQDRGVNDAIDTNIKVKTEQFNNFVIVVWAYFEQFKDDLNNVDNKLDLVSTILQDWSTKEWADIRQPHLTQVFCLTFIEWYTYYAKVTKHDKDTWNNEEKNENKKS